MWGGIKVNEPTLSFAIETFVNVPMAGVRAVIVRVVEVITCFQLLVAS